MDKVSCIITTVDREVELFRAITSCLTQTYKNLEVIVIIDGKNENLMNKVNSNFNNKIVHVYETKEKVGGNATRNYGIRLASGEYIALLDDDDEWMETKIEKQFNEIRNNDEDIVVFCSLVNIVSSTRKTVMPLKKYNCNDSMSKFLFDTYSLFRGAGFVQTSTLFSKKKTFLENPFDESLKKHQDWDWVIKCSYKGIVFKHINEPLVLYHNENKVNRVGHNFDFELTEVWLKDIQHYIKKAEYDRIVYTVLLNKIIENPKIDKSMKNKLIRKYVSNLSWKTKVSIPYLYHIFFKHNK